MVGATGKVAANQTTDVAWQTSGRISKISVKLGDKVNKGDLLAELDPTSLSQGVITAKADLVTAQQNLVNLQASAMAKANAQMKLAQAKIDLKTAQDNRTSANYKRAGQATLKSSGEDFLKKLAAKLRDQPNKLAVCGYTDSDPVVKTRGEVSSPA